MKKSVGVLVGILTVLVFASSIRAEVIAQQLNSDYYAVNSTRCDGKYDGTTFKTGAQAMNLTSFKLKLGRYSTITSGYLTAHIKQVSGSQDELIQPPFLATSTNTVNIADIVYTSNSNVPYGDVIFSFNNVPLNPNTHYASVITSTGYTTTCTDNLVTRLSQSINPYTDGLLIQNSWTFQPLTSDLYFIVEGTTTSPPPPPAAPLSLRLPFRDGESWQVTCGYNNQGGDGCLYHTDAYNSYYALDFDKSGLAENQEPGEPVFAPASGKVVLAGLNGGFGYSVKINTGNGYEILLAHLRYSPSVKVGQYVFQGEQVGIMGGTGTDGIKVYSDHIHVQVYYNGNCKNNVPESKPEPMSEQTNFTAGAIYPSDNDSPLAIYHLDSVLDSSSNGNHAVFQPTCLVQGCLTLNGTVDEYLQAPNSSSLQLTGDMSIVLWLKPENIASGRTNPLDKAYSGEFSLVTETDGSLSYYHGQSTSNYFSWMALTPGSITNSQGIRVVITRDNTAKLVKSYVNGALVATTSYGVDPSATTNPIRIGLGNTGIPYKGKQDEIAIYPRVLTDNEINNDYYASAP